MAKDIILFLKVKKFYAPEKEMREMDTNIKSFNI